MTASFLLKLYFGFHDTAAQCIVKKKVTNKSVVIVEVRNKYNVPKRLSETIVSWREATQGTYIASVNVCTFIL